MSQESGPLLVGVVMAASLSAFTTGNRVRAYRGRVTFAEFLAALRRRKLAFLVCVLAGIAGGIYHGETSPTIYRATSSTVISVPAGSNIQDALAGAQLSRTLLGTYAQIATSRKVAERVVESLGLPETPRSMEGKISANASDTSFLIEVSASDADPIRAASIADAASRSLAQEISSLESGKRDPVRAELLDAALVPSTPVSPRPRRDAAAGLLLGLLLGGLAVIALENIDRTVKGPAQLSELSQAPLLGMIPRIKGDARGPHTTVDHPMSPEAEAYRALRTALRFIDVESPLQTVLITSPGPSEGKTTTATHFAIALAQSGERVVLVDADLRRGSLLESFGLPAGAGITSVVTGVAPLAHVLQTWRDLLAVVGTGPLPPNPAEILGSQSMASLLDELRGYADIIVIDAPPVLPVTDAVALSTQVDGVVVVARDSKTSRQNVAETRRRLEGVGAHVVGCVLNGVRTKGELYADYRYLSPVVETPTLGRRITDRLRR